MTARLAIVGNRAGVASALADLPDVQLVRVVAVAQSRLASTARVAGWPLVEVASRAEAAAALEACGFDVLVSNGCPWHLPVERLGGPGRHLLNVHPSLLPALRGRHPANGALLLGAAETGATLHRMESAFDTGAVIHQAGFPITDDLDLGLLYRLLFACEAEVARDGIRKLAAAGWDLPGTPQAGEASSYSRQPDDQRIDLAAVTAAEVAHRIRAFGIPSQGITFTTADGPIRAWAGWAPGNPAVAERLATEAGALLVLGDGRILVGAADGPVLLTGWERTGS